MNRQEIEIRVKRVILDQLDVEAENVKPESVLIDDLYCDSLDIVELVIDLEDEFDFNIPDEDIDNFKTVKDVMDYVESNA